MEDRKRAQENLRTPNQLSMNGEHAAVPMPQLTQKLVYETDANLSI